MRGQMYNLTTALKDKMSPWQLVQMPLCSISKSGKFKYQVKAGPHMDNILKIPLLNEIVPLFDTFLQVMSDRAPCFSFC